MLVSIRSIGLLRCDHISLYAKRIAYNRILGGEMAGPFADKRTERFASGHRVPAFSGIEGQAHRRLFVLRNAPNLAALRGLQSNRLEALKGDRAGQYSIRINN